MEDNRGREYKYQADWSISNQMFHVRCDDWTEFTQAVKDMESIIPKSASFPDDSGPKAGNAPASALGNCPKCGNPLVTSKKKDGTIFIKCSTNKWDRNLGRATGCDYVKWPEKK